MSEEETLEILPEVIEQIRSLLPDLTRGEHHDYEATLAEWDMFSRRILSITDATAEGRAYRIDAFSDVDYYALVFGGIQSFVAYIDNVFVILWFGKSSLTHEGQEEAKRLTHARLEKLIAEATEYE